MSLITWLVSSTMCCPANTCSDERAGEQAGKQAAESERMGARSRGEGHATRSSAASSAAPAPGPPHPRAHLDPLRLAAQRLRRAELELERGDKLQVPHQAHLHTK